MGFIQGLTRLRRILLPRENISDWILSVSFRDQIPSRVKVASFFPYHNGFLFIPDSEESFLR